VHARNLTPDTTDGHRNWTIDQIVNGAAHSATRRTARSSPPIMPWMNYADILDQDDAVAIASYLKSLPPIVPQEPRPDPARAEADRRAGHVLAAAGLGHPAGPAAGRSPLTLRESKGNEEGPAQEQLSGPFLTSERLDPMRGFATVRYPCSPRSRARSSRPSEARGSAPSTSIATASARCAIRDVMVTALDAQPMRGP
jgi:hypothetical protein